MVKLTVVPVIPLGLSEAMKTATSAISWRSCAVAELREPLRDNIPAGHVGLLALA
jgi:hypothetical protein